jgi:sigma-B regulation protein RsbU (phosphoserine phosphatase)
MAHHGKILVVEDDPEQAAALAALISEAGFATEVRTGIVQEDIGVPETSGFDAVFCALELAQVSWGEGDLTLIDFHVHVPVIFFSRDANSETMLMALRLGAADFFPLPIEDPAALYDSLDRCVRLRNLSRELQESRRNLEEANRELEHSVRVLEQDQQAGRQVQLRMLPATPMVYGDYVFSHTVIPSLYLSGDFTDYFTVGEHLVVFFMADVSGHGSSSAFTTVLLKNLFARKRSDFLRRDDHSIASPVTMLRLANKELLDLGVGKFATMIVGVIDTDRNTLCYSVAGHLPLPVLVSDSGARYLQGEGSAVGLMEEVEFQQVEQALPEAFMLALFSDGILEILPQKDLIEKERFFLSVFEKTAESPLELVSRLGLDTVDTAPDDIAALFISKRGPHG